MAVRPVKRHKGFFVVLEGPDLSGKSTQAARLVRALRRRHKVVHTREPGGTRLAESIRRLLLDARRRIAPVAELLLYEAARAQHVREKIRPALERGAVVVSERFTMATLAYQGCGRGLPLAMLRGLNRIATGGLEPDLTLVLDLPEAARAGRGRKRLDRLEKEPAEFGRRVRDGYRRLARLGGRKVSVLDGSRPPGELAKAVFQRVQKTLRGQF